jgi:sulfite exporter TauE/SafE
VAYTTLGALAGTLGAGLDRAGELAGVQRSAGWAAGALLVLWGIALLAQALDLRVFPALVRGQVPDQAARFIGGVLLRFHQQTHGVRAALLGLLTGALPCGWLYVFVVTAGGTGSAWRGSAFMALFWAGTVPALVAIAVGMRRATGALQRRVPVVSAMVVIAFGVVALGNRAGVLHRHHAAVPAAESGAHVH